MRAREFVSELNTSLSDIIKAAAVPAQPQTKNLNANVKPTTGIAPVGSMTPQQASAQQQPGGGTQTTQDGIPKLGTTTQSATGAPQQSTNTPQIGQPDLSKMQPAQLQQHLKPGSTVDLPNLGKMTVGQITPQGVEFDASKVPSLGAKKITVDLKSLGKL